MRSNPLPHIVILGAGPTGLGAAWRLNELRYSRWHLYEKQSCAGGLASSFQDYKGFTWDIGGHVQFSHYTYFDKLMDKLLGNQWLHHEREAWIWILNQFIPYPFQNNIGRLPRDAMLRCLYGLIENAIHPSKRKLKNFHEWIHASFGKGIADLFIIPYNYKVWAHYPQDMNYQWIGERVATINLDHILENIALNRADKSWGPNNTFRFPRHGGTGAIWKTLAQQLPTEQISYNKEVISINTKKKQIFFSDGSKTVYDKLITTLPLDVLLCISSPSPLRPLAKKFVYSTVHIFGVGLRGKKPASLRTKCWMYFPEKNCPFYRVTVFSNYSPNNVPRSSYWSLMTEVSESSDKHENHRTFKERIIQGLLQTKLIYDRSQIVSFWHHSEKHGYPTPFLKRDSLLQRIIPALEQKNIYSRGRFGAWKYEVSNQDHSLMQGVEVVNRLLLKKTEQTLWHPEIVNNPNNKK